MKLSTNFVYNQMSVFKRILLNVVLKHTCMTANIMYIGRTVYVVFLELGKVTSKLLIPNQTLYWWFEEITC